MKKVLIAADEVDKWSRLCEGLQTEWECTTVNLDAFEKFHTIAVYDAVLMLVRNDNGKLGRLIWEVRTATQEVTVRCGFRRIEIKDDNFRINGRRNPILLSENMRRYLCWHSVFW